MSEAYRLYTEADYSATTKTTNAGASQAWDNASALGGIAGDISFTIAPTKRAYVSKTYPTINAGNASVVSYRYYFDVSGISIPSNLDYTYLNRLNTSGFPGDSRLTFINISSVLNLGLYAYDDSGTLKSSFWPIVGTPTWAEIKIYRSSNNATADGYQELYVDGVLRLTSDLHIIYDAFSYSTFYLGPWFENNATGTAKIGKFLITDDANPIGPLRSYRHRPRPAAIMKKRQRIKGHRCG